MSQPVNRLFAALRIIQEATHRDITANQVTIILYIMQKEGVDVYEMAEKLDLPQATLSRITKEMSKYVVKDEEGNKTMKGWNIISPERDLENTRKLIYVLTAKGKELKKKLENLLAK